MILISVVYGNDEETNEVEVATVIEQDAVSKAAIQLANEMNEILRRYKQLYNRMGVDVSSFTDVYSAMIVVTTGIYVYLHELSEYPLIPLPKYYLRSPVNNRYQE